MKNFFTKLTLTAALALALSASALAQTGPTTYRVSTISQLVAITLYGTSGVAWVGGLSTVGDGLGGVFFYSSTSSAATNVYMVFKPINNNGRWLKHSTAIVNQNAAVTVGDETTYPWHLVRAGQTNFLSMGADNDVAYIQSHSGKNLHLNNQGNHVVIGATAGNVAIGITSWGTGAVKALAIGNGTAPSTSPTDAVQVYSADVTAGNAALHVRGEDGSLASIGDGGLLFTGAQSVSTTTGNLSLSTAAGNGDILLSPNGSGKVGVGTTAPSSLLSVAGTAAAGALVATNSITVGGGTAIIAIYSAAATIDFPSIVASSITNMTLTVTGATTNSAVAVSVVDGAGTAGVTVSGYVSAANTVTIIAENVTVNAINPAATIGYRAVVFQY